MKKTLAQLKRDAKNGNLVLEMVERFGKTGEDIPPRLRGPRPLVDSNSVAIMFRCQDGAISEYRIPRASLVDYEDDFLTVYRHGHRPLTEAEAAALEEWKQVQQTEHYQQLSYSDAMTDGSSTYWWWKHFWHDKGMDYMACYDLDSGNGRYYDASINQVWDLNVRGDVEIRYRIVRDSLLS